MTDDRCKECGIQWRVSNYRDSTRGIITSVEVQSFAAAIYAANSIRNSWIEVYSPSENNWWRVVKP